MAEWQFQRDQFYKEAIRQGLWNPNQISEAFPLGTEIPTAKLEKWLTRFLKVPEEFASQRRYINRFRLGADPEFVFSNASGRQDSRSLHLKQGPAFGADNNGRLAEIRPYPSRSALEVVASVWATFKWMAITRPETLNYGWLCSPYIYEDGLGGHVHFGRKRPFRDQEVSALDTLADALVGLGVWPVAEVMSRQRGDSHRQHYGMAGDWRIQTHGYEYRTFPSWLDSPGLAFLVITLAKLAVYNPILVRSLGKAAAGVWFYRIKNLLAYYKDMDDDARLALLMLAATRGALPRHQGGDFKGRWGIFAPVPANPGVTIIPNAIRPSAEEIKAMFEHLAGRKALPVISTGTPTWSPWAPPKGYAMVLDEIDTYQVKGLGEMVWDLCSLANAMVSLRAGTQDRALVLVSHKLASLLPNGWEKPFKGQARACANSSDWAIWITPDAREHRQGRLDLSRAAKKILTSGVFPLWKVSEVEADSYLKWKAQARNKRTQEFIGKVLYQTGPKIPGVVLS